MFKGLLFFVLTTLFIAMVYCLDKSWGTMPSIGSFFHPFTGFIQNASPTSLPGEASFKLPDLNKPATIVYDAYSIPHVFASTEHDVYFLQGYITAMDRLWQMDIQTRSASGRLSEIIGSKTLSIDREKRRLGLMEAAEKSAEMMLQGPSGKSLLAFTDGVNAYIKQLKQKDYPLEYKLLHYKPEPWKPVHSALLLKLMAERLTANEADIENTNFIQAFGKDMFDLLFPAYVVNDIPIISSGTHYPYVADTAYDLKRWKNGWLAYKQQETIERQWGSNNWAIHSSKSQSGHPILCNDPHLALKYPCIWYEMHLVCPGLNVYGVTLPGAPGIIIGFNEKVAWGLTNAGRDVRNWYAIDYGDNQKKTYWYDGVKKAVQYRYEVIKVKGEKDFIDTIGYTHHGPIVYDNRFQTNQHTADLALTWTAHIPSNELKTFYGLNRAHSIKDYYKAIQHFVCPGQNFVFASASGDIAIKQQGLFPYSKDAMDRFVLEGRLSQNDMRFFVPVEHNPTVLNPSQGFVFSANQHPTDPFYPYAYSGGEFEYNRNRRIHEFLSSKEKLSVRDMMLLQQDEYNLTAKDLLGSMFSKLNQSQKSSDMGKCLADWDMKNTASSKAAVCFELWTKYFQDLLFDEMDSIKGPILKPDIFVVGQLIQHNRDIDLFDIAATKNKIEGISDIVSMSFDSVAAEMDRLKSRAPDTLLWGHYKSTEISHLAMIPSFGDYGLNIGGRANIVNAVSKTWGPSWRMIVELTPEGPLAYGIYPGGQSGNPGSPHYKEYTEAWKTNSYRKLVFGRKPSEINNRSTTLIINN